MKKFFLLSGIYTCLVLMCGCISLKPITELTGKSLTSLAIYEEVPVTYLAFCEERCQFNLIRRNQVVRATAIDCDCKLFASADAATTKVYKALTAYFKSLQEISAGKLTTYDTKALSSALVEGKFASLTIDKNTVNAYSSLGRLLMQVVTERYRRRKISSVIETGNPAVQNLLTVLQTSMANVVTELDFQKERNHLLYSTLLMENQTSYDKVKIGQDYYAQINSLTAKQSQLKTFSKSLGTIAAGHQKLFDNRNKITTKQLIEITAEYSATLQDLLTDFKKL